MEKWITRSNADVILLRRCGKPVEKKWQLSTFPHFDKNFKKLSTLIAYFSTYYPHIIHILSTDLSTFIEKNTKKLMFMGYKTLFCSLISLISCSMVLSNPGSFCIASSILSHACITVV